MGNRMMEIANQVRRKKAVEYKWFLYGIIDENPGLTGYELSKKVNWSIGRVNYYAQKLLKDGMINNTAEIVNGRAHKRYYGKTLKEFLEYNKVNFLKEKKENELDEVSRN